MQTCGLKYRSKELSAASKQALCRDVQLATSVTCTEQDALGLQSALLELTCDDNESNCLQEVCPMQLLSQAQGVAAQADCIMPIYVVDAAHLH